MARYFIEKVKCGIGEGGMACGPVSGPIVAEVKVREENGEIFYLSLAEVDGCPNFFKTEESTYNMQVFEEMTEEDADRLNEDYIPVGLYEEIFQLTEEDDEMFPLYRYLIYIVRADWDECKRFQKETEGKYMDEVEIPMCDLEEDYLKENE